MLPFLLRFALLLLLAYVVLSAIVYFLQDRLIFFPRPLSEAEAARLRALPGVEELFLEMRDGTRLHGWFAKSSRPRAGAILYFGGNAEEVSGMLAEAAATPSGGDWSWVLVNYRGYGLSAGRPGEKALLSDALEIYDRIAARPDVDPDHLAAFGRSLGTGVAVQLAARRPLRCLFLVSPYGSLSDLAREALPWLPVRLLLRHRFPSLEAAPRVRIPAWMVYVGGDRVIPPRHSLRLAAVWGGPAVVREIRQGDHNSLSLRPEYRHSLEEFLGFLSGDPLPSLQP